MSGAARKKAAEPEAPAIATDFDVLLAAAMSEKVAPVPLDPAKRPRPIKVIGKDGAVVGVTTHGHLLDAAIRFTAIQTALADEKKRPTHVTCAECGMPREVKSGQMPKRCAPCAKKKDRAHGAAWRAANPEKAGASQKAYAAANPEKVRAKDAACNAARYAANPEKACARTAAYRAKKKAEREAAKSATEGKPSS